MPMYVYVCDKKHRTEVRQGFNDQAHTTCPKEGCEAPAKRVIESAPPVAYKGGGWTVNETRGF